MPPQSTLFSEGPPLPSAPPMRNRSLPIPPQSELSLARSRSIESLPISALKWLPLLEPAIKSLPMPVLAVELRMPSKPPMLPSWAERSRNTSSSNRPLPSASRSVSTSLRILPKMTSLPKPVYMPVASMPAVSASPAARESCGAAMPPKPRTTSLPWLVNTKLLLIPMPLSCSSWRASDPSPSTLATPLPVTVVLSVGAP